MAQHRLAAVTSGFWRPIKAALQQSISPIAALMLHSLSPECMGTPANALPANISKSAKDVNRFLILVFTLWNSRNTCQAVVPCASLFPSSLAVVR